MEVRRITTGLLDVASGWLRTTPRPDDDELAAARAALREVRSMLRLARSGLDERTWRTASRRVRDAQQAIDLGREAAVAAVFDDVADDASDVITRGAVERVRGALTVEAVAARRAGASDSPALLAGVADDLDVTLLAAALWPIPDGGFDVLADGFDRAYREGRQLYRAVADGDITADVLDDLAVRTRDHHHHVRALRALWPPVLKPQARQAGALADLAERHRDLVRLRPLLTGHLRPLLKADGPELLAALDVEHDRLAAAIAHLGARVYADPAKVVLRRLGRWWASA